MKIVAFEYADRSGKFDRSGFNYYESSTLKTKVDVVWDEFSSWLDDRGIELKLELDNWHGAVCPMRAYELNVKSMTEAQWIEFRMRWL
ncbi:hypothetical protein LNAOJCKE_0388 [Methylorubrum aminovorans]|uniref:Uncharacterized protein n=1 Tax=Methylorubrum aminovorans TaxID=269069 RepID=A0ABQ4U6X0_9HYPH|nr:hypothetical protein [Methylorubrum aminovorans]GJE63194.1 hypothetical protein LNAOJCKE_0388 [Methylorubrum aminovorans]GMA79236.1 hypothetical protein GCM10025880_56530 [Methylorubrum aminovorans]